MEWARARCAALVFASTSASKTASTASVVLACSARRWAGDRQSAAAVSLRLSAWRFLATAEVLAPAHARRCRATQRTHTHGLRVPKGWVLATTATLGHPAAGRGGIAKCATVAAVRVSSRWPVAVFQISHRRGSQPADLHALHSTSDRIADRRGKRKFQVQPNGIARWCDFGHHPSSPDRQPNPELG